MIRFIKTFLVLSFVLLVTQTSFAQIRYGNDAHEIALPSVNGDTLKLSSLKGKVVLLDFWASWCGPCRSSNKHLTKVYSKYKEKGFEIFGVSFDVDHSKWKNAISTDKITWLQVIDDGGRMNAQTAIKWNIEAIPTSYLIDKNGKLVAMDLEGKELEKALKKMLEK